ncbi:lytic transglycosylase [Candidatus Chlamydia sanziniae]|uniref:Membrane-bound lytic murein transglycosylase D n=1 Tax=Candidatus Chlamydia sanziniae TaxID=1806891 RepID=A0A1A9HW99_9CHLA|nr:LysM peptidoglycan-binding domain-containing protein [Candidatus Chlamydia sanziniae]ANH78701.1 Membrane-bound lytic murein transglycosylase D precursor [Candidatus Chlamydia sanziniae]
MNRRNMVITAVLVNTILLAALFVTSKRARVKDYAQDYREFTASKVTKIISPEEKNTDKLNPVVSPSTTIVKEELAAQFIENKPTILTPTAIPSKCEISEAASPQQIKETSKETYATVIVKKGDFLERIARANHTTVAILMQINDLTSTQLKIGQVIKVPILDASEIAKNPQTKILSSDDYYIVQEGDSPWTIALRNHIRLEELLQLNDLDEQKARRLKPGDKLRMR